MIGLSDNQLEVIMRKAAPLSEENCQEFLERVAGAVAAILQMRGQINDDDVAVAVQLALGALIHNSAAWQNWNRNRLPTRRERKGFNALPWSTKPRKWVTQVFAASLPWVKISIPSSNARAPQKLRLQGFDRG